MSELKKSIIIQRSFLGTKKDKKNSKILSDDDDVPIQKADDDSDLEKDTSKKTKKPKKKASVVKEST